MSAREAPASCRRSCRGRSETTPGACEAVGPYTPVVRAGDWLVVSGQVGIADGKLVPGGLEAELRQAMANLRGQLDAKGASLTNVVKTTVFLRHMSDYALMNEVYIDEFGDHRPRAIGHRRRGAAARCAGGGGGVGLVGVDTRRGRCRHRRARARLVLPVVFIVSGLSCAIILGGALKQNGEDTHEGSELIDLNR